MTDVRTIDALPVFMVSSTRCCYVVLPGTINSPSPHPAADAKMYEYQLKLHKYHRKGSHCIHAWPYSMLQHSNRGLYTFNRMWVGNGGRVQA